MRLFSRATSDSSNTLQSLVGSMSLAMATYKPTPILPTSLSSVSNVDIPVSSDHNNFQVAGMENGTYKELHVPHQEYNATEWGQPSTLYVPQDWATSNPKGNNFAKTVGPMHCPVRGEYTPVTLGSADNFSTFDPTAANIMRYRKQIAVNLGSWFVLENWMVPSMFTCTNHAAAAEHDFLTGYGVSAEGLKSAKARLEQHWDTWIRKKDFEKMAGLGINTIRLPIGYWYTGDTYWLDGTPFQAWQSVYENQQRFIARAIRWAAEYNIGVLIDLHGAYGSQNGQPHSGVADNKIGFFTKKNMDRTTELLVHLTEQYANVTNVIGIETLNEPNAGYRSQLYPWLHKTIDAMRKANNPQAKTFPIFFHDGFSLTDGATFVAERSDFVVQDNHQYWVYSKKDQSTSAAGHTSAIEGSFSKTLSAQGKKARNNLIVGEWSCALAPSSLEGARDAHAAQSQFCDAQSDVFQQHTGGWSFWSWRLENCEQNSGWCFQATINQRLMTSPIHVWTNTGRPRVHTGVASSSVSSSSGGRTLQQQPSSDNKTNVLSQIAQSIGELDGPTLPFTVSSAPSRRGYGSPAARAAQMARDNQPRAALSASEKASNTGYSDGYLSAKMFASQGDADKPIFLSRLGFGDQYIADSFEAHVAEGKLQESDHDTYASYFEQGLSAAEDKVAALVKQHTSL